MGALTLFGYGQITLRKRTVLLFQKNAAVADTNATSELAKAADDIDCKRAHLSLIHDYFTQTAIKPRQDSTIDYCEEKRHESFSLDEIISLYKKYGTSQTNAGDDPVTSFGVLPIRANGQDWQLPLYQIADIRYRHLSQPKPNATSSTIDLNPHMKLMGLLETDEHAPLLAHELGGNFSALNVIPMAASVHRYLAANTESSKVPKSYWKSNEEWIQNFLNTNKNGRVEWKLALEYDSDTILHPKRHTML